MIRRITNRLVRIAIGVALSIAVVIVAAILTLNSHSGTQWTINRIAGSVPGTLEIGQFEGTLWSGLDIPLLIYRDTQQELRAVDTRIEVSWSQLVRAKFVVNTLDIHSVEYRVLTPEVSSSKPFELEVTLTPITVGIVRSRIGDLTLHGSENSTEVRDVSFDNVFAKGSHLRAERIAAVIDRVQISASTLDTMLNGDVPLELTVNWSMIDDQWLGGGAFHGSLASLKFDHTVSGPYPAIASGEIEILHRIAPEFSALLEWERWAIDGYSLQDGTIHVTGTADRYEAKYRLAAVLPGDETAHLSGKATGNMQQLSTFDAKISNPAANVDVVGSLAWRPSFSADTNIHASSVDPSRFINNITGSLDAEANVRVDGGRNVDIADIVIAGMLNNARVNAHGDVTLTGGQINCAACSVQVGDNVVRVDGSSDQTTGLDLAMTVNAPSLDLLWPDLSGSLNGKGSLTGTIDLPQFTGDLNGQALRFAEWSASAITVSSQASTAENINVVATVSDLLSADAALGTISVAGIGAPNSLDVDIEWLIRELHIRVSTHLDRDRDIINGVVTRATIAEPGIGISTLDDDTAFRIAGNDVSVEPHSWSNKAGQLRVSKLLRTGDDITLIANVLDLPLQSANSFLPATFQLSGSASADIDVTRASGLWTGFVRWEQKNTVVTVANQNEPPKEIPIPHAGFEAQLKNGGAVISSAISLGPGIAASLDLTLVSLAADSAIVGEFSLQGNDWTWIPTVFPAIDKFDGAITANVSATGPMSSPEFSGDMNWRGGSLEIPALNVPINDIEVTLSGSSNGAASVTGSARAGDGDLNITGQFENLMRSTRTAEINLTGKGAELVNWPEYHLWASPELVITGSITGWTVNGKLDVPRADIVIREIPEESVKLSPDVMVLGREETLEPPTRVSGEAQLVLGDKVRISAFGLETGLHGDLLVKLAGDRPLTADGQVALIDGVFSAYGQQLTIEEGTLTFTGPLDNPEVDVRAVRTIESIEGTIKAGIHLRGRAQSITSTVYSDPVMEEVDALSYLVVGRPLNQASNSDGDELSNAAVALGAKQAARITQQIGQSLGLDELTLAGTGGDATALVAGKQLNSRLHARYAYGVFSRLGTLLLRYRLSNRLSLEAGAGEAQSIDILYLVEKE